MTKTTSPRSPSRSRSAAPPSLLQRLNAATTQAELDAIEAELNPRSEPHANKKPPTGDLTYDIKRIASAERERRISHQRREIAHLCPPCKCIKTRAKIKRSLRCALETLWPARFNLKWGDDHLEFIKDIECTIKLGGQLARAMPRGTGKTSILLCAVIWAVLNGYHQFVVLICSTGTAAKELLEQIRTELESNDRILDYYPEAVFAIRKLEGIRQRRLLWNGVRIIQESTKDRILIPNLPENPAAGSIIMVAGLTARIRGLNYQRYDGVNLRPSLVLIDDPQTRKSAGSKKQNHDREETLCGDVLGLAGPDTPIAALMACTVIFGGDLSDRMLDPEVHPEWQGKRTALLKKLPENLEPWNEYGEIYRTDLRNRLGMTRATEFYRKRRQEMDKGALAGWPARFKSGEISAIQHAMNLRILNRSAFESEYQNCPLPPFDAEATKIITADEVVTRMNRLPRGMVPMKADHLTAFIDVHGRLLYWMVCWWKQDATGGIVDYGTWPKQGANYFTLREANPTMQDETALAATLPALRAGLDKLIGHLMTRDFQREDGSSTVRIDRMGIDCNWGEGTDVCYEAIRQSPYVAQLRPMHGKGITITNKAMATWNVGEGDFNGGHWFRHAPGQRHLRWLHVDTNWWKSFVHNGLNLKPEERHSISLFSAPAHEHRMLADHLTSATKHCPRTEEGHTVDIWTLNPACEDHLFDTLVGNSVIASEMGVTLATDPPPVRPKDPPRRTIKAKYL